MVTSMVPVFLFTSAYSPKVQPVIVPKLSIWSPMSQSVIVAPAIFCRKAMIVAPVMVALFANCA